MGSRNPGFGLQTEDYNYSASSSFSSSLADDYPCSEVNSHYLRNEVKRSRPGTPEYVEAKKELDETIAQIKHEDDSFAGIGKLLLIQNKTSSKLLKNNVNNPKYAGNDCFTSLVSFTFDLAN
ncbi:hypothetical protein PanWU01x14_145470 [Parasponia andersonii]|uniref:Uncharacterized protein n=1 Tax=Parasponia andersonii TaxID=3476 RepID=A0A2P5CK50_PARAD|nr:hypothetical protein PanWU01x14_145470 [Parasponia andersonii]